MEEVILRVKNLIVELEGEKTICNVPSFIIFSFDFLRKCDKIKHK